MVVILGGGIAGLAASAFLEQHSHSYQLYEQSDKLGGLLKNFEMNGFTFDHCIHLAFGDNPQLNKVISNVQHVTHDGKPICFDNGLRIPHPIQHNLYYLDTDTKVKTISSFVDRPIGTVENYSDWLQQNYGEYFATKYPIRYNSKYWNMNVKELSTEWIGPRMTQPDLTSILYGAFNRHDQNHYYAPRMKYPKKGGFYSFIEPLTNINNAALGKKANSINLKTQQITFTDKTTTNFNKLINTIPLPELIRIIDDVPDAIRRLSVHLQWTSVHLVSFGLKTNLSHKILWEYIYDEDILASRVYSPSLKSQLNAPLDHSSLQFEIYQNSKNIQKLDKNMLIENCKYALDKMNLAKETDIVVSDYRAVKYGNIVFNHHTTQARDVILNWLSDHNILGAGRFGCWDYLWSHQAFESGWNAAKMVSHR